MEEKDEKACRSEPTDKNMSCCRVESLISIDERGQMVLPKEIRKKANIHAGDKFAVVTLEKDGEICCISLVNVEQFTGMVKVRLGPVMHEIFPK